MEGSKIRKNECKISEVERRDIITQFKRNIRLLRKVLQVQRCIFQNEERPISKSVPEPRNMEAGASLLSATVPNVRKIRLVNAFQNLMDSPFLSIIDKHDLTGISSFSKLTEVGMHGIGE